jgi:hypothetical protein
MMGWFSRNSVVWPASIQKMVKISTVTVMDHGRIAEYIVAPRPRLGRLTTAGDDFEACFDARDRDEVEDVSGKRL